jgi:hypothetical protein
MPRGGARPGAGRKAKDRADEPLFTYSFTIRLTDIGVLNRLGHGNLSLGLRRLIDQVRAATAATERSQEGASRSKIGSEATADDK